MESGYSSFTVVIQVVVRVIPIDQQLLDPGVRSHSETASGSSVPFYIILLVIVLFVHLFSDEDTDFVEQFIRPVLQLLDFNDAPDVPVRLAEQCADILRLEAPVQPAGGYLQLEAPATANSPKVSKYWIEDDSSLKVKSSVSDGVNGVYFVQDEKLAEIFGVFKPRDEEAFAPSNPKDRVGQIDDESPLKSGAKVGDAYKKEVAAFFLDRDNRAGVPETKLVSLPVDSAKGVESKIGSLQRFVANVGSSEDFSPSKFSVDQVHYIGLLDARLANLDRHLGNLLVSEGSASSLVPIDHGYSLPDYKNLSDVTFEWSSWKQASLPFSDEVRSYVESLDIIEDVQVLKELELRSESIWTYVFASAFVKAAVAAGWTLKDIASFMQRNFRTPEQLSGFEGLVSRFRAEFPDFDKSVEMIPEPEKDNVVQCLEVFKGLCAGLQH